MAGFALSKTRLVHFKWILLSACVSLGSIWIFGLYRSAKMQTAEAEVDFGTEVAPPGQETGQHSNSESKTEPLPSIDRSPQPLGNSLTAPGNSNNVVAAAQQDSSVRQATATAQPGRWKPENPKFAQVPYHEKLDGNRQTIQTVDHTVPQSQYQPLIGGRGSESRRQAGNRQGYHPVQTQGPAAGQHSFTNQILPTGQVPNTEKNGAFQSSEENRFNQFRSRQTDYFSTDASVHQTGVGNNRFPVQPQGFGQPIRRFDDTLQLNSPNDDQLSLSSPNFVDQGRDAAGPRANYQNGQSRPRPLTTIASRPRPNRKPATLPSTPKNPQGFQKKELPGGVGTTNFQLAAQPKADAHWESRPPIAAEGGVLVPFSKHDFAPDPTGIDYYDPYAQQKVYQGKTLNANQRPMLELFKPWYQLGQLPPAKLWLGRHNPVVPQFLLYGDFRTAVASNKVNGNNFATWAFRLNLDFDFRLTSTERFHWFMGPLDRGQQFTRFVRDNDDLKFISEFDPDIDFGFLEGDLGALWGGFSKTSLPFDLPFAIGNMPLLFQNGVWMEDAFVGAAFTIPAKNSPALDISNMDVTFIFGYDKINSPAFGNDDNAAKMYGIASFIEAGGGYFEIDYAFLEDRTDLNRSYHNTSIGFTRRYGRFISNSIRVINNAGQNPNGIEQTADGTALLFENSLITKNPLTFIPYFNTFIGFDTPQSAARAAGAGGILRNTGILFETDGLTGYPTLDADAKNTFGGAIGLNILAKDLSQQLVLEAAMVQPFSGKNSSAPADQFGLGVRYQLPLTNAIILRMDGMVGFTGGTADRNGVRVELRHKW